MIIIYDFNWLLITSYDGLHLFAACFYHALCYLSPYVKHMQHMETWLNISCCFNGYLTDYMETENLSYGPYHGECGYQ